LASIDALNALGDVRQPGGKRVIAFGGERRSQRRFSATLPISNGRSRADGAEVMPKVDRAAWFDF
jgi:predicted NUDIX family NTP pyrophosphohydrolase